MNIFHAYDIRGKYPSEINEELMERIGRHLPRFLGVKTIMVARDARASSPSLAKALRKGLREAGCAVIDVGITTTPEAYYGQKHLRTPAGAMITASHNPKEYNGLKILGKGGETIGAAEGLHELETLIIKEAPSARKKGTYRRTSIRSAYVTHMTKGAKRLPYRVVFDQSNSAAGGERTALNKLCTITDSINTTPDGSFPGHPPNPLDHRSQRAVQELIKKRKADLGVILDGDADRVVFLDENGREIPPDIIIGILAASYPSKSTIIYEVRSSKAIPEYIKEHGQKAVLSAAGRTIIIHTMKRHRAVLGGEKSGHYMFKETYHKECTTLAIKKVMQVMHRKGKPLSTLADNLINRYSTLEETNYHVKDREKALLAVEKGIDAKKVLRLDGISLYFSDASWLNLRASNTEPLLRLNAESPTKEGLRKLVGRVEHILKRHA